MTQIACEVPSTIRPEDHLPMVRSVCRKYARPGLDVDDLAGEATLTLLRAARNYDPARGPWGLHLSCNLHRAVAQHARSWKKLPQEGAEDQEQGKGIASIPDHRATQDPADRIDV